MVHIPGAEVRLPGGSTDAGRSFTVGPFDIDITEVAAQAYSKCVKAKRCLSTTPTDKVTLRQEEMRPKARAEGHEQLARHPMNFVNPEQAAAYSAWVGKRLPTEAEWVLAARAARPAAACLGGPFDAKKKPCWHRPWGVEAYTGTCPVATHPDDVSPYGVYDMAGNVREIVLWAETSPDEASLDATAPSRYLELGFSWEDNPTEDGHDLGWRVTYIDDSGADTVGFRCARRVAGDL
jgi:formylglycine-generating enzyme required for sulfatase activity